MSLPPPARPDGYPGHQDPYRPVQDRIAAERTQVSAPTLAQYWRSDSRHVPGRKPAKWAGRVAFWLGMLSAVLFFAGLLVGAGSVFAAYALPVSAIAFLFALIAIIAGIGRGLGIFGLILALAGSSVFWGWLAHTFG